MAREITTGVYWFYRRDLDSCGMDMDLALQERVDGAALQAAAGGVRGLRTAQKRPGAWKVLAKRRKSEYNTSYIHHAEREGEAAGPGLPVGVSYQAAPGRASGGAVPKKSSEVCAHEKQV